MLCITFTEGRSVKKTRRPMIGGILTIVSGALASLGAVNYAVGLGNISGLGKGDIPPFVPSIIFGVPALSIVIGVLALAGGILAMQRKKWKWSLAGSIAGTLSVLPLGIPAIILIALSKDEFE
ncbi:MAG: hypothetical protein ISS55_05295 [Dehalococcoidales bacterium]|nr:hypothetical protein [Dehalococcoidales bacterium]